ncbi:hypothetical protein V5O48_009180 [Marasmius crinis-equi]|uniref:F-box domain-containing protein n=1 Tax=Marasmius crinis-equi TaxID=585013 RepID=A0ABR3FCD5_9AGAR
MSSAPETTVPDNILIDPRVLRSDYCPNDAEVLQMKSLLKKENEACEKYWNEMADLRRRIRDLGKRKQNLMERADSSPEEKEALEACQRDIADLNQRMGDLDTRQRALNQRVTQRLAVTSPLRRNSVEVWRDIFSLVCSSTEDEDENEYGLILNIDEKLNSHKPIPIILSHVCSRWRRILNDNPEFWSSICIKFSSLPPFSKELLGLYLENSEGHPLDISIEGRGEGFNSSSSGAIPDQEAQITWDTLKAQLHRCGSLTLDGVELDLDIPQIPFPNLVTLKDNSVFTASWQSSFRDAPLLSTVITTLLYPSSDLPYSQLTSLRCQELLPDELEKLVQEVLPACQDLEDLTFGLSSVNRFQVPPPAEYVDFRSTSVVELPSLRTLEYDRENHVGGTMSSGLIGKLFGSIRTPVLESLSMQCEEFSEEGWTPSFFRFLTQPGGSLQHLTLNIDRRNWSKLQSMSSLMEALPGLTEFELEIVACLDVMRFEDGMDSFMQGTVIDLFQSLEVREQSSSTLVPNLDSISVSIQLFDICKTEGLGSIADILDPVLKVAESRNTKPARLNDIVPLTSVSLSIKRCSTNPYASRFRSSWKMHQFTPEERGRIENLLKDGVNVMIYEKGVGT